MAPLRKSITQYAWGLWTAWDEESFSYHQWLAWGPLYASMTLAQYFNPSSSHNANALRASVAMYFVFSVFFTSLGVISWVYPSEIFPMAIRARGTSLSTFTNWALNLVFAQCSPIALSKMGYRYFYIFMALNWLAAVLVYLFYPETLSRTLEQLDELFGDKLVAHALDKRERIEGEKSEDVQPIPATWEHDQAYKDISPGV